MINNLGLHDIVIDFDKMIIHNDTKIYFSENDINTAKIRAKLVKKNEAINLTGTTVSIRLETITETIDDTVTIVDATNGIIEYTFPTNTLIEGVNFFVLFLTEGDSTKVSPKLAYKVLDSIEGTGAVEGTNEYPILIQLISETNKAINKASSMQNQLETVIDNANTVTNKAIAATESANDAVDSIKNAIAAGTRDLEVKEARDGEVSLKARLERDLYKDGKSLKECISDIEGLKEVQDMQYETDKGYIVAEETQSGVVKDLKIKGKTLVNLYNHELNEGYDEQNHKYTISGEWKYLGSTNYIIKPKATYTMSIKLNNTVDRLWLRLDYEGEVEGSTVATDILSQENLITPNQTYYKIIKFTTRNFEGLQRLRVLARGTFDGVATISEPIILEGDHTQNPPSYFEGLQSVGEDVEKIEVLTRKEDGNLIDDVIKPIVISYIFIQKGSYVASCKATSGAIRYYRQDGSSIDYWSLQGEGTIGRAFTTNEDIYKILFDVSEDATELQIIQGAEPTPYEPYKAHKKEILYKDVDDTYKPVPILMEWDEIDDTKRTWFKRSGKIIINGSEDWEIHNQKEGNTILFGCSSFSSLVDNNINSTADNGTPTIIICDKLTNVASDVTWFGDADGLISINATKGLHIRISKSKLESQDVQGFKKWLQANPVTVVYQLAEPQIYDIAPINLDAYANKTMVCCTSGAISPHMSFAITSYISNLVLSNKERIKSLEDKFTEMFKQVLSGDMQSLAYILYPTDFEKEDDYIMMLPVEPK